MNQLDFQYKQTQPSKTENNQKLKKGKYSPVVQKHDICGCKDVKNACEPFESQRLKTIYDSNVPVDSPQNEPVNIIDELNDHSFQGLRGINMNKEEEDNFAASGHDIKQHKIRDGPTLIKKKYINSPGEEFDQKVTINYLKPPTPPPRKIILKEQPHKPISAPPLIVRIPPTPLPSDTHEEPKICNFN